MLYEKDSLQFMKVRQEYLNGSSLYQGTPYTTQETLDVIGEEGIKQIAERIKKMLEWKEMMYKIKDPKKRGFLVF